MRKQLLYIVAIIIMGLNSPAFGQNNGTDANSAGWGTLNYAVPESPAFKILGVTPSNILRPATTRDIAVSVGNFLATNGATIPNNIAVAISPSIFNPRVTLANYKQNQWWYNSALSFGTKQNSDKSYAIALGLSFKLIDKADLRLNDAFSAFIDSVGPLINAEFATFSDAEAIKMAPIWKISPIAALARVDSAYADSTNPQHKTVVQDYGNYQTESTSTALRLISSRRESLKKTLWNAEVLEIGLAGLLNSRDSLLKNITTPPLYGVWATYGLPFTTKGQLLLGVNWQDAKDSATGQLVNTFNAGLRLYFGSSDFKGFIQGEGKYMDHQLPTYDAGIGIETTFFGGLWLDLGLGAKKVGNASWSFNPTISFSFGNGEKNKVTKN